MKTAPVSRLQRLLSVALLLLLLLGAYILIDRYLLGQYEFYQDNIAELQDRLQRVRNIIAMRPDLEARLQQTRQDDSIDAYYLQQSSSTLAATELQQLVKSAIESNGGDLVSTQILPVSDEGAFSRIAIRVQMTGDTATLQKMLHTLESARPLLFVDNLQIRSQPIRQRDPDNRNQIKVEIRLTTQFELAGYVRRGGA